MPKGMVKWVDPRTGEGRIRRLGREYPVRLEDMEASARATRQGPLRHPDAGIAR
ncbi:MAG: hypothetical protein WEB06_11055 [Actinomycetota bacterium]